MQVGENEDFLAHARVQTSSAETKNIGKSYKLDASDIHALHKATISNDEWYSYTQFLLVLQIIDMKKAMQMVFKYVAGMGIVWNCVKILLNLRIKEVQK